MKYTCCGRFDLSDPSGPRFAWSGCTVRMRFRGRVISLHLAAEENQYVSILVDGEVRCPSLKVKKQVEFPITGLSPDEHEIWIVKKNEFQQGSLRFLGACVEDGEWLEAPEPRPIRLEVVGDSITCAFGVEASSETPYDPQYDNAMQSYGWLAAQQLGAEVMLTGCSGYGVLHSYDRDYERTLPMVYDKVLPETSIKWDASGWNPDAVVVNLGTNDFAFGTIPDLSTFCETYIGFLKRLRGLHPRAVMLVTAGPLMTGEALTVLRACLTERILPAVNRSMNKPIHYMEFEPIAPEDGFGISGHPSRITHEKMGNQLANELDKLLRSQEV